MEARGDAGGATSTALCVFPPYHGGAALLTNGLLLPVALWLVPYLLLVRRRRRDARAKKLRPPVEAGAARMLATDTAMGAHGLARLAGDDDEWRCDTARDPSQGWHPNALSISAGDDPTAIEGFTTLHAASAFGNAEAIDWLVARGANLDACRNDCWNHTALHYAAANGHAAAVRALLSHGADASLRDAHGRTPLTLAREHVHSAEQEADDYANAARARAVLDGVKGHREVCKILESSGSAPDTASPLTRTSTPEGPPPPPPPPRAETVASPPSTLATILEDAVTDVYLSLVAEHSQPQQQHSPSSSQSEHSSSAATIAADVMNFFAAEVAAAHLPPPPSASSPMPSPRPQDNLRGGCSDIATASAPCAPNAILDPSTNTPRRGSEADVVDTSPASFSTTACSRAAFIIGTIVGATYLAYRGTCTIAPNVFSIAFYACEGLVFFSSLVFFFVELWSVRTRGARHTRNMQRHAFAEGPPSCVDVLIPCLSEALAVIEATVRAARILHAPFPNTEVVVHVLDDGGRDDVAKFCKGLRRGSPHRCHRLRYHRRPKQSTTPHHAKAGNLNHALLLGALHGDFVAVLDVDMIPRRDMLQRMLPHFYTLVREWPVYKWHVRERTAYVQAPQDFYNVAPDDPVGHRSSFFYEVLAKGRQGASGCVPCVGTNVVFRRAALVSIGGQALRTVTEDHATSLQLARSGFSAVYVSEHVANGLAPSTIQDTFKQRRRWAIGSFQLLWWYDPLTDYGLPYAHRAVYGSSSLVYLTWTVYLVLQLAPLLYLWGSIAPFGGGILALDGNETQRQTVGIVLAWSETLQPTALFLAAFLPYFVMNRVALFAACAAANASLRKMLSSSKEGTCENGVPPLYRYCSPSLDLWRGWQMSVYMIPTYAQATAIFLYHEILRPALQTLSRCCRRSSSSSPDDPPTTPTTPSARIDFDVTRKALPRSRSSAREGEDKEESGEAPVLWRHAIGATWPHACAVGLLVGGLLYGAYGLSTNPRKGGLIGLLSASFWGALIVLLLAPPLATLVPPVPQSPCCGRSAAAPPDDDEAIRGNDDDVELALGVGNSAPPSPSCGAPLSARERSTCAPHPSSAVQRRQSTGRMTPRNSVAPVVRRRPSGAGRVPGVAPFMVLATSPRSTAQDQASPPSAHLADDDESDAIGVAATAMDADRRRLCCAPITYYVANAAVVLALLALAAWDAAAQY